MRVVRNLALGLFMVALVQTAGASIAGRTYRMLSPMPGASFVEEYPVAGGHAHAGDPTKQLAYRDGGGNVVYRQPSASIGMSVSEYKGKEYGIGDYLEDIPDGEIDWTATEKATRALPAGQGVFFVPTYEETPSDTQRVFFTTRGNQSIVWVWTDKTVETNVYSVALAQTPHRLYWTGAPFNAPTVTLPAKDRGYQLLGGRDIVIERLPVACTAYETNNVSGVLIDTMSYSLRSYVKSRRAADGETSYEGPEGQFVLVCYTSPTCRRMQGYTVVEVGHHDPKFVSVRVGDELLPTIGAYDPKEIVSQTVLGLSEEADDPRSPYVFQQDTSDWAHKRAGRLFAIAPTVGEPNADSKIQVYWKSKDGLDILWPFESVFYKVDWNPATPDFVIGDADAPGLPVAVPPAYASVELCKCMESLDYLRDPGLATYDRDAATIAASRPGWFTAKLVTSDNFWYVPFRAIRRDDPRIALRDRREVDVGTVVSNAVVGAAGLPGYIYEPASADAFNWDPALYHGGRVSDGPDAFAALGSAISLVSAPLKKGTPVEVWWPLEVARLQGRGDSLPVPLTVPSVVGSYLAVWPKSPDLPVICIASDSSVPIPWQEGRLPPRLYVNNHAGSLGYNPNEEHAYVRKFDGGYGISALRVDLNAHTAATYDPNRLSPEPLVLVEYDAGGVGAMQAYRVVLTNEAHAALASSARVASPVYPFGQLNALDGVANARTYYLPVDGCPNPIYRDRRYNFWFRRDGVADGYYYYPLQKDFWWTPGTPEATRVGWMNNAGRDPAAAPVADRAPMPWRWTALWPDFATTPKLHFAQVLTRAKDGVAEVFAAKSVAVVYPSVPIDFGGATSNRVVELIDPTVAQRAGLPIASSFADDYGFVLGSGAATARLSKGKYYFMGLPPNVADRFYIDTAADPTNNMVLVGRLVEPAAGLSYLQVNVLSPAERQALKDICKVSGINKQAWDRAVDALARTVVNPVTQTQVEIVQGADGADAAFSQPASIYRPQDSFALAVTGEGVGWVVTIENDNPDTSMVPEGATVSMNVAYVMPDYAIEGIKVVQEANNQLSECLDLVYTAPLGAAVTNFVYEWRALDAPSDGRVPEPSTDWFLRGSAPGLTSLALGSGDGQGKLDILKNRYYALRLRAAEGSPAAQTLGALGRANDWSRFTDPALAEGWVQRVMNALTPFAQRMRDFAEFKTELALSMPAQIGAPYEGDVALNVDNLPNVGLLQLYQTVLNKAESFSLGAKVCDPAINSQLLLAADRLATLYALLGDEAYADAKNPAIAVGDDALVLAVKALPTTAFCFAGQVPTLLDEELALLRGRTFSTAPDTRTSPYYNRLPWNFTRDIAGGEPAYVMNYNIAASGGELGPEQAAAKYPQGHGDAWGHYLSAVKAYYRLLRNPCFSWGDPAMSAIVMADATVNVDYREEEKLAQAAADLVKTGLDVTDLTCRKQYRDENGQTSAGYLDDTVRDYGGVRVEQGFGYGEVAVKTGLAAFYNWATVNALLPADATNKVSRFEDRTIDTIDRGTVPALFTLADGVRAAETKLNNLDAGLNPLGLSQNAVPFDIDPAELHDRNSHYDQIRERAERALVNAQTVLDNANEFGSYLRTIENFEATEAMSEAATEADYTRQLIAFYGTPYAGDIGPGKIYPQGYEGPDIYHYMYIDLAPYGLSDLAAYTDALRVTFPYGMTIAENSVSSVVESNSTVTLTFSLTADGLVAKPADITGVRRAEGSIQAAYRDFLTAYVKYLGMKAGYDSAKRVYELQKQATKAVIDKSIALYTTLDDKYDDAIDHAHAKNGTESAALAIENTLTTMASSTDDAAKVIPTLQIFGLATSISLESVKGGISIAGHVAMGVLNAATTALKVAASTEDYKKSKVELEAQQEQAKYDDWDRRRGEVQALLAAIEALNNAEGDVEAAHAALLAAQQLYRTRLEEAQRVCDARTAWRKGRANVATQKRYQDMYLRVQRNAALSKYTTAFDTAQRYVWELAKVYDYETGLLSQDRQAGDAFLNETIATRSLGKKGTAVCAANAGGGLWDVVKRMDDNWAVLKGRLGVNNPDETTKWFSLRYSLFRIAPDAAGDAAWRQELMKYWRDDILIDAEFRRYCEPPASDTMSVTKVPGLIIPFATAVNAAENFFGRTLQGGETTFSSTLYATKIYATAVAFSGYDRLSALSEEGLASEPEVYLVPVGRDCLRAPIDTGNGRETLKFSLVDQVLPLPHLVGAAELADDSWLSTFSGLDGTVDSVAKIRRHAAFGVSDTPRASRLVGRSVWNDRWLLVIPASSLNGAHPADALRKFISGVDDIRLGIRAYSRSGN